MSSNSFGSVNISLTNQYSKQTAFPKEFLVSHDVCLTFVSHFEQIISYIEDNDLFEMTVPVKSKKERDLIDKCEHVHEWLLKTGNECFFTESMHKAIFPALFSDMIECIKETLHASKSGKLNIAYMLVRKPIQESLHVLERMYIDYDGSINQLIDSPSKLNRANAGGLDAHKKQVEEVLSLLGSKDRLSASYLVDLRYNKKSDDSFDSACNLAMHLFTSKDPIKTTSGNLNFIFSNEDCKITQWSYLYSRLPYVLYYMLELLIGYLSRFIDFDSESLNGVFRQIACKLIILASVISDDYKYDALNVLVERLFSNLKVSLRKAGIDEELNENLIMSIADNNGFLS